MQTSRRSLCKYVTRKRDDIKKICARDFNRDVSAAQRAALNAPVVVTDRGEPAFVLMSIAEYRRLTQVAPSDFLDRLRMTEDVDVPLEKTNVALQTPDLT